MLFNEPKLLKYARLKHRQPGRSSFSALQRAEIAEMGDEHGLLPRRRCFSALQRAEIAEIYKTLAALYGVSVVSVLFNEPKLLKFSY